MPKKKKQTKNVKYWQNRAMQREQQSMDISNSSLIRVKAVYEEVNADIHKEVSTLISKYANDNGFTMVEAKQRLTATEKADLTVSLKRFSELHKLNSPVIDEILDRISTRIRITRLEAVSFKFDVIGQKLLDSQLKELPTAMAKVYNGQYYKKTFDTQSRTGIGRSFAHISKVKQNVLTEYIGQTRADNFSKNIWGNTNKLVSEWGKVLEVGIVRGSGTHELMKDLSQRTEVSYNRTKTLVRTETSFIHGQATADSYKEQDVEEYEYLATLDSVTTNICQNLDLEVFKLTDMETGVNYPPMHYNCRSTTLEVSPQWMQDITGKTSRTARDENGKNYSVPSTMNYEEWHKKHVLG